MKTTIPDTHLADPAVQRATDTYTCAYLNWLIEGGDRPDASAWRISEDDAYILNSQVRAEMHRQLDAKAPVVFFSENEARKAAEDLRHIATMLCEMEQCDEEKICRTLAQKFDTWRKE